MLRRLEFGTIRRQEIQVQMGWAVQTWTGMPACTVKQQADMFMRPSADKIGESQEGCFKSRNRDSWHEQPGGATGGGLDKSINVQPLVTWVDRDRWTLPAFGPHPAQDGLEADAMFVHRPGFHRSWSLLYR